MVLSHGERIEVARSAVAYLTGHDAEMMKLPVPACPGWTVYNAAVHVARVYAAWGQMMTYPPGDADARDKAYAAVELLPHGVDGATLAQWANETIDRMADEDDRPCYFSFTGGSGTTGLWAWHAAAEVGVHRLDVEAAVGDEQLITDTQALDAATYVARYVTPALRRFSGQEPGSMEVELLTADGAAASVVEVDSESDDHVVIRGSAVPVLMTLWGRSVPGVDVVDGDPAVLARWRQLPSTTFQFGTWD